MSNPEPTPSFEEELQRFEMSEVHAPSDTKVLFVDSDIKGVDGERLIGIANLNSIERLRSAHQEAIRQAVEAMLKKLLQISEAVDWPDGQVRQAVSGNDIEAELTNLTHGDQS